MPYLVEGGAQLFLLKNSRLEYQFILLSNKTQGNRGACFSPSISDLSEQLLEVTPVLLQNICKDRRDVGIVERHVDSSRQILVHEFFFFSDTATNEIYTLSLHDALPISGSLQSSARTALPATPSRATLHTMAANRSEEHTSELQSPYDLVCRLLLEK